MCKDDLIRLSWLNGLLGYEHNRGLLVLGGGSGTSPLDADDRILTCRGDLSG